MTAIIAACMGALGIAIAAVAWLLNGRAGKKHNDKIANDLAQDAKKRAAAEKARRVAAAIREGTAAVNAADAKAKEAETNADSTTLADTVNKLTGA